MVKTPIPIIIMFLFACLSPGAAFSRTRILVVASESGKDHPMYSIAVRILPEAYRMIGCDMELKLVPAMRAIAMFERNEADSYIFADAAFAGRHPNSVLVKTPLGYDEFVVFTTKVNFKPDGWESLKPYSIGYLLGMVAVEENIYGMNIDGAQNRDEAFRKLIAGRTDIVVLPRFISMTLKNKYPEVKYLLPPLHKVNLYTYLNTGKAALAPKLASALSVLEASGRIREVTDQVMAEIYK